MLTTEIGTLRICAIRPLTGLQEKLRARDDGRAAAPITGPRVRHLHLQVPGAARRLPDAAKRT